MTRSRLFLRLLLVLALVFAGLSLYWWVVAGAIRMMVAERLTAPSKGAAAIRASDVHIGGYPFDFTISLVDVTIDGMARDVVRVHSPAIEITRHIWSRHTWRVVAPDGIDIALAGPFGHRAALGFAGVQGKLVISDDQDASNRAHTEARLVGQTGVLVLDGRGDAGAKAGSVELIVQFPAQPVQSHMLESLGFNIAFRDVTLPRKVGRFGDAIARFELDAGVLGNLTLKPEFPPERDDVRVTSSRSNLLNQSKMVLDDSIQNHLALGLADWRDDGGTLEIHRIALDWGSFSLTGDGTMALDKQLQPIAALSTAIRGWPDLLDSLVDEGVTSAADLANARAGLAILAGASGQVGAGGAPLRVPLTLQNGVLSLEKAKIAKVPVLFGRPS